MEVEASNLAELDAFVVRAGLKYWAAWISGQCEYENGSQGFGAILYKPSGLQSAWTDSPDNPHPGGRATQAA
jgi:hypothetical protein